MRADICILSGEPDFAQMLLLELSAGGRRVEVSPDPDRLPDASLYLVDSDAFPGVTPPGRTVRYGRSISGPAEGEQVLVRPFSLSALHALLASDPPRGLTLSPDRKSARLHGATIPLTAREAELLSVLLTARGKPVTREELYARVFGGSGEGPGVVNVYIHYLRRKLERDGRRILLSLRGQGYVLRGEDSK